MARICLENFCVVIVLNDEVDRIFQLWNLPRRSELDFYYGSLCSSFGDVTARARDFY